MRRSTFARASATVFAIATLIGPIAAASASASVPAASWTAGACTTPSGITVIVDRAALGGGVTVRCVAGPQRDGFAALTAAGFVVRPALRSPGFLCQIDGVPADDPCINPSPADAYWSYWTRDAKNAWAYSNVGAAVEGTAPAGSVQGWWFSDGNDGAGGGPSIPPPPPVTTPPPTAAPTAPPATSPSGPSGGAGDPGPTPTTTRPRAGSTGGPAATVPPVSVLGAVDDPSAAGSTTVPLDPSATTVPTDPATTVAPGDVSTTTDTDTDDRGRDTGRELASGSAATGDGDLGGPPVGTILGVGLVGVVAAGAVVTRRQRLRADSGDV